MRLRILSNSIIASVTINNELIVLTGSMDEIFKELSSLIGTKY